MGVGCMCHRSVITFLRLLIFQIDAMRGGRLPRERVTHEELLAASCGILTYSIGLMRSMGIQCFLYIRATTERIVELMGIFNNCNDRTK